MSSSSVETDTFRSARPVRLLLSDRVFAPVAGASMLAIIVMPDDVVSLDPDEDALIGEEELEIGTDPNDFDTAGDGLGDGAEDREDGWNTDPLKAVTDGDNDNDNDELLTYGTDPNDASDFPADDAQSPAPSSRARPSSSAQPTVKPSASSGGAITGLPGTSTRLGTSNGSLTALLASDVLGTIAAAVGLRRRQA